MPETHYEIIHFSGHVQGVGFRYSTLQASKEFEVCGNVRNLPDGRVEVQVEGTKAEIELFVRAIDDRMHGHIKKTERSGYRRDSQFSGFSIC